MSGAPRGLHRALVGLALACACSAENRGYLPPDDEIFFPGGLVLDPLADPSVPARWLYVGNANSDLAYSSGTVVVIDLAAFWDAFADPGPPQARSPSSYCADPDALPCTRPVGATVTPERPCRRVASSARVIECDESPFVTSSVSIGNFGSLMDYSLECDGPSCPERCTDPCQCGDSFTRLWLPIRGDPSVGYVDVRTAMEGGRCVARVECDEGRDEVDPDRCGSRYRLGHLRNDDDLVPVTRDPFSTLTSASAKTLRRTGEDRLVYVAHVGGGTLTLIDADGLIEGAAPDGTPVKTGIPAIVDARGLFAADQGVQAGGGYGLAERPCFAVGEGPRGAEDPEPNVPGFTRGCTRPLLYGTYRYVPLFRTFTAGRLDEVAIEDCAAPDQLGEPGKVVCDAQLRSGPRIGAQPLSAGSGAILGGIAFADARGDELLVVQTNPGALGRIDTSVVAGEIADLPKGAPVELCGQPSNVVIYDDGIDRLALVNCFQAGSLAVVELESFVLVREVLVGTGPHALVVDYPRAVAYVANSLDKTISVVDLSRERGTRFSEIARLGLQDPYTGK